MRPLLIYIVAITKLIYVTNIATVDAIFLKNDAVPEALPKTLKKPWKMVQAFNV
jgi:hypothetical protein